MERLVFKDEPLTECQADLQALVDELIEPHDARAFLIGNQVIDLIRSQDDALSD